MAHAQTLEQVGAKHPHKTDVVHPLHQLRFRRTGANGGDVLHRGVGQGHPGGIAVRECRFFLEKLPKQCCIALRRAVVAGFIQLPGKREQGVLVLAEGIAQMSQYLGHADQLRRPAVLAGQGAEQLLLLGKLQIISCIFQIRGRENIRQFLPEVTIGQPGERRVTSMKERMPLAAPCTWGSSVRSTVPVFIPCSRRFIVSQGGVRVSIASAEMFNTSQPMVPVGMAQPS